MRPMEFMYKYRDVVIHSCLGTGILPSVKMAQAIINTGWGATAKENNVFGLVAEGPVTPYWDGSILRGLTHEFFAGGIHSLPVNYRRYPDIGKAISDHTFVMQSSPGYTSVITKSTAVDQCLAIQSVYFPDCHTYAHQLMSIIHQFNLQSMDDHAF